MKTEVIIERVYKILYAHKAKSDSAVLTECEELIADLQAQINTQTARQGGKRQAQAAALRILKTAEKYGQDKLTKALTTSDGMQLLCDGFRAVKLSEPLPVPCANSSDIELCIDRIIKEAAENVGEPITPPSVAELKSYIAMKKAEAHSNGKRLKDACYKLADGVVVDALLLVDLLQILPDAVLIPSGVERWRGIRPIFLKSAHGCGVLCPIRTRE